MRIVCSLCKRVRQDTAKEEGLVSHGMCALCFCEFYSEEKDLCRENIEREIVENIVWVGEDKERKPEAVEFYERLKKEVMEEMSEKRGENKS